MSLQNEWPNRRKFLERTALGAGSLLLAPELLTSCTDHRIPDPGTPKSWPIMGEGPILAGDADIDWNDDAKSTVAGLLGLIPEAGEILSMLVEILWPTSGEDIWGQIKDQVNATIDQKISENTYNAAKADLDGLKIVICNYQTALYNYNTDPSKQNQDDLRNQWYTLKNDFDLYRPKFQVGQQEAALLPLFAQYTNLYLGVLRDGVINIDKMGFSPEERNEVLGFLPAAITYCVTYTINTYTDHLKILRDTTPVDNASCQPFNTLNYFNQQMTLSVLDYWNTWHYYDIVTFPDYRKGVKVTLPREIYMNALGTCYNSGNIVLPKKAPTQGPTKLVIEAGYSIGAYTAYYDGPTGPDGNSVVEDNAGTDYMSQSPYKRLTVNIDPNNPIVGVNVAYRDHDSYNGKSDLWNVDALQFKFKDTTVTDVVGVYDSYYDFSYRWIGFTDHYMTSIHFNGLVQTQYCRTCTTPYWAFDSVVLGFQYIGGAPAVKKDTVERFYITSPRERSGAELAQAFPHLGISQVMITDQLKAARQAHWAAVKACAT